MIKIQFQSWFDNLSVWVLELIWASRSHLDSWFTVKTTTERIFRIISGIRLKRGTRASDDFQLRNSLGWENPNLFDNLDKFPSNLRKANVNIFSFQMSRHETRERWNLRVAKITQANIFIEGENFKSIKWKLSVLVRGWNRKGNSIFLSREFCRR